MTTISFLEVRKRLADTINRVAYQGERAVVTRHNKGMAALVSMEDLALLERLEHIILSHQGELEWGAAALACTPEALFVAMADNFDAKMGMVQRALRQAAAGEEFSERLPGLESALLTRPPPT